MTHTSVLLACRYRLESRIAVGGMGEVWKGTDDVLTRPVAVKLLRAGYAQHPGTLARFRSEARHAGSLSHPGIAHVYDYGEAELPYLVMELVDGPSLAGLLGSGALDPGRAMDVVAQAAAGLQAAHQAGLVHRDIKPGNLLLGPGGQLKITDFGISHAAGSAPLTGTGILLGTPAYLAPERIAGQAATPASDLYSLGVVAWECLVGTPPFTGAPVEVALAHREVPLPPLPGAVPADVAALIAALTAKDPRARPPGAGEVAERAGRLRDAISSRSTLSLDTGPDLLAAVGRLLPELARPVRWRRDRRLSGRAAALGAGVLIAAVILGVLLSGLLSQAGSGPRTGRTSATAAARPGASEASMVEVSSGSLAGQPVSAIRRQLQQLGLVVRLVWQPSSQDPGTVLSVQPSGRVPAGSVIAITVASPLHLGGHGHGHGGGQGHGDGGD
jgi:eukaryotic-like serine/threonine-protein kinase